jgi:hypothetical protein
MFFSYILNIMTKKFGTRSEVVDGLATFTRGGLSAGDLMVNKSGKIVSKKKSELAKKNYSQYGFKKRAPPPAVVVAQEEAPKKKRRRRKKKDVQTETD